MSVKPGIKNKKELEGIKRLRIDTERISGVYQWKTSWRSFSEKGGLERPGLKSKLLLGLIK